MELVNGETAEEGNRPEYEMPGKPWNAVRWLV